jgi:PAS domain S-box-containing protein
MNLNALVEPSAPPKRSWRLALEGPVLTLAMALGLELMSRVDLPLPHPTLLFVLPTLYAAYRGGLGPAMASAIIAITYAVVLFDRDGGVLDIRTQAGLRLLVEIVTFPLLAILVGLLHARAREQGEAAARQSTAAALEAVNVELKEEITRRLQQERILRDREKRIERQVAELEQLYTWTPVGLGLLDSELRFLRVNESLARIHGIGVSEHLGRTLAELAPDYAAAVEPTLRHVLVSGQSVVDMEVEGTLNRALEAPRNWLVSFHPLRAASGHIDNIIVVVVEITERQRALAALKASEEMYRILFETAPDPIAVFSAERKIVMANGRAARVFGWPSPESMIGHDTHEIIAPEDWVHLDANREVLLKEGSYHNVEYVGMRKDGSRFPFESDAAIIRGNDGKLRYSIGMARDISERKRAEEHRQQFVSLVENSSEFIGLATLKGELFFVNRAARQLVGAEDAERRPTVLRDYFDEDEWRRIEAPAFLEVERTGSWRGETMMKRFHNGEKIPVDLTSFTVADPETGQPMCLAAVARDIRERRKNEEALRDSARQLQALTQQLMVAQEAERRHLARELHDEIGQVLTAISINLQALKSTVGPDAVGRIDDSIGIVDRAIKQVRNLSLDLRPSMLDDLGLEAALRWYTNQQAVRAGITVQLSTHLGGGRLDAALETACFRIVQEALTNIVRHAHARTAWIEVDRSDRDLSLSVRDDGSGFDAADLEARLEHGASAGLVGMRERVRLLKGELEFVSGNGHGTSIHVRLPLAEAPPASGASA